jgi:hypothetical protein
MSAWPPQRALTNPFLHICEPRSNWRNKRKIDNPPALVSGPTRVTPTSVVSKYSFSQVSPTSRRSQFVKNIGGTFNRVTAASSKYFPLRTCRPNIFPVYAVRRGPPGRTFSCPPRLTTAKYRSGISHAGGPMYWVGKAGCISFSLTFCVSFTLSLPEEAYIRLSNLFLHGVQKCQAGPQVLLSISYISCNESRTANTLTGALSQYNTTFGFTSHRLASTVKTIQQKYSNCNVWMRS